MAIERPVPESRLSRLAHLGRLAGGVLRAGARQLGQGKRPAFGLPAGPDQTATGGHNVLPTKALPDDAGLSLALQE